MKNEIKNPMERYISNTEINLFGDGGVSDCDGCDDCNNPAPKKPSHTGTFICTHCGGEFSVNEQNYVDPENTVCNACYAKINNRFVCSKCGYSCPCSFESSEEGVCKNCYVPPKPDPDNTESPKDDTTDTPSGGTTDVPTDNEGTEPPENEDQYGDGGTGFYCAECGEYCPCDMRCIDKDGREVCMLCYRNPGIPPEPNPGHTGQFICSDCGRTFDRDEQHYIDPNTTVCNSCFVKYDRFICTECLRDCPCSKRAYDLDICYECYCKLPICPDCKQRVPSGDRYDDKTNFCKTCGKKQEKIPVERVSLKRSQYTLSLGEVETLVATVSPENATVKTIEWESSAPSFVSVDSNGVIHALRKGEATIYARATDGSGAFATCNITVIVIPVNYIFVRPKAKTLSIGETITLEIDCEPYDATDRTVEWKSDNGNVAHVDRYTGLVTAKSDGTAIITATTVNGNVTDYCTITVDSREKVFIREDNYSFYVQFSDGLTWKYIGLDLSKRKEYYTQFNPPVFDDDNYFSLIPEEQRYLDNTKEKYSIEQIAYLYLIDPLGIEYYMRNDACSGMDVMTDEIPLFKDAVYEAIFGTQDKERRKFYFTVDDGKANYNDYLDCDRLKIYSNAEVLFGFHTIINWDLGIFIKSVLTGLFNWAMSESIVGKGIEAYQMLFHTAGILNDSYDKVSSYATEYLHDNMDNSIENKLFNNFSERYNEEKAKNWAEKATKSVHWVLTLFTIVTQSAVEAIDFPNPLNIILYDKVHVEPPYLTVIEGYDGEMSLKDIANIVNQD